MQGLHYPNRHSKSLIRKFHSVELDCQALENYFDILTIPLCKGVILRPQRDCSTNLMMLNCPMVHSNPIYFYAVVELGLY